jgi:uncharacterized membrane-anchored protein
MWRCSTRVSRANKSGRICGFLPGHADLSLESLQGNFLRLRCDHFTVKWERHTEFTRYSIVQALPEHAGWGAQLPELAAHVAPGTEWLRSLPGQTMAAIQLGMLQADIGQVDLIPKAQAWLGEGTVLASRMGNTSEGLPHSCILTHFRIGEDGFERMLVLAPEGTSEARAGRISQRLLEMETYRMMALRGLPVAKNLSAMLSAAETQLADITGLLERKGETDQALLDLLVSLAARIERATAEHGFSFSATRAYDTLVSQRLVELRERPISGTQTLGEFMQRRLSPAMATVQATEKRLASLAERVSRTSALLRTRVDIATEAQNQVLVGKTHQGPSPAVALAKHGGRPVDRGHLLLRGQPLLYVAKGLWRLRACHSTRGGGGLCWCRWCCGACGRPCSASTKNCAKRSLEPWS